MTKYFGTDGIRGIAGEFPLDYSALYALGEALANFLHREGLAPRILIGRDTRESGVWMEAAIVRGIRAKRGKVISAGVIPTSAVSFLTRHKSFSAGLVISASHNPFYDNGIKIFSSDGMKIGEAWESRLEEALSSENRRSDRLPTFEAADIQVEEDCLNEYGAFLKKCFPSASRSNGFRVALDCSNGAGSQIAPRLFKELGFEVEALHNTPNGQNINKDCGSLHPEALAEKVLQTKSALGVAFDGDADRAIWVDETGKILNGDHTLFVQALFMKDKGRLRSGKVIATSMSNMGLEKALQDEGLILVRTRVGDKYVLEEMLRSGANLGGEQSGHTIFLDDLPAGDGILTSLKMAEVLLERRRPLSKLVEKFKEYPQVLVNVRVARKDDFRQFPEIACAVAEIKASLGANGRLDLRYSGTEPLARIMIEGTNRQDIDQQAGRLANVIQKHLGE